MKDLINILAILLLSMFCVVMFMAVKLAQVRVQVQKTENDLQTLYLEECKRQTSDVDYCYFKFLR